MPAQRVFNPPTIDGRPNRTAHLSFAKHIQAETWETRFVPGFKESRIGGWKSPKPNHYFDATYQAIPELVETHTVSEDGLTHTMALRQGVKFHNGEDLTAADALRATPETARVVIGALLTIAAAGGAARAWAGP